MPPPLVGEGGGVFHQSFGRGVQCMIINGSKVLGEIRGQKDLRTIKTKGVNKIENQGQNWYKML